MDSLEEIDTELDVFFVNHGDVTICSDEPNQVFKTPSQGTSDTHGERIYRDIYGNKLRVFVTETEADGDSPMDSEFWVPYLQRIMSLDISIKVLSPRLRSTISVLKI